MIGFWSKFKLWFQHVLCLYKCPKCEERKMLNNISIPISDKQN